MSMGRPNREEKNFVDLMQSYIVDFKAAHARARATYDKARAEYARTLLALPRSLNGYDASDPQLKRYLSLARATGMYGSALVAKDLMNMAIWVKSRGNKHAKIMKNDARWVVAARNSLAPYHRTENKALGNANFAARRLRALQKDYAASGRRPARQMPTLVEQAA